MDLSNQRGQTLVEYILLLAVAVSLVITFYNSEAYRRLFGPKGEIGANIKKESEFTYAQAFPPTPPRRGDPTPPDDEPPQQINGRNIRAYPSYTAPGRGTRFFGPKEPYQ